MTELKAEDRVRINPTVTFCPWKGKPTGVILFVDTDGTAAVEVEGNEQLGHSCMAGGYKGKTENGWWFMLEELELIGG